ncbi:O-antigen ligase family protein [Vibrio lentus]
MGTIFVFLFPVALLEFIFTGSRNSIDETFNLISLSKYILLLIYLLSIFYLNLASTKVKPKILKLDYNSMHLIVFMLFILAATTFTFQATTSILGVLKINLIIYACYLYSINSTSYSLEQFWKNSLLLTTPLIIFVIILGVLNGFSNGFSRHSFFIFNLTHYLPYVITLFLYALFCYKGKGRKTICLVLSLYVLITASRGGLLALLLSVAACYIFLYKDRISMKILMIGLLTVISIASISFLLALRVDEITSLSDEPYRYKLIEMALFAIFENPIVGNGYLTFVEKSTSLSYSLGLDMAKKKATHNTHLEIAYSFGVFAYFLLLNFFYRGITISRIYMRAYPKFGLFYATTIVYLFIHSFTVNMESLPLFWFVLATTSIIREDQYA